MHFIFYLTKKWNTHRFYQTFFDKLKFASKQNSAGRKLWSSGRALGSRSDGRGFDPRPIQC